MNFFWLIRRVQIHLLHLTISVRFQPWVHWQNQSFFRVVIQGRANLWWLQAWFFHNRHQFWHKWRSPNFFAGILLKISQQLNKLLLHQTPIQSDLFQPMTKIAWFKMFFCFCCFTIFHAWQLYITKYHSYKYISHEFKYICTGIIFVQEFLKSTVDLADLVGIHFVMSNIAGKGQLKFLIAGVGWATAELIMTR